MSFLAFFKEQDPYALGPIVLEATRTALQKRYCLLPYLYTLFYRSHVFGDTVIRPLFFEYAFYLKSLLNIYSVLKIKLPISVRDYFVRFLLLR